MEGAGLSFESPQSALTTARPVEDDAGAAIPFELTRGRELLERLEAAIKMADEKLAPLLRPALEQEQRLGHVMREACSGVGMELASQNNTLDVMTHDLLRLIDRVDH